jgi:hypothetical protein
MTSQPTKHPHPGPMDPLVCPKCGVPKMRPGGGVVRGCDCPPDTRTTRPTTPEEREAAYLDHQGDPAWEWERRLLDDIEERDVLLERAMGPCSATDMKLRNDIRALLATSSSGTEGDSDRVSVCPACSFRGGMHTPSCPRPDKGDSDAG